MVNKNGIGPKKKKKYKRILSYQQNHKFSYIHPKSKLLKQSQILNHQKVQPPNAKSNNFAVLFL